MKHDPWRFALCGSFNGCGFRSLFHFAALLTGTSRTNTDSEGRGRIMALFGVSTSVANLALEAKAKPTDLLRACSIYTRLTLWQLQSLYNTGTVTGASPVLIICCSQLLTLSWRLQMINLGFHFYELATQTVERFWTVSVALVRLHSHAILFWPICDLYMDSLTAHTDHIENRL